MDEIRPWLFIGNYRDTKNTSYLEFKSIRAMLQLAEAVEQPGIVSLYLPVEDMGETPTNLIKQGMEFILTEKQKGSKILVACGAGINRSAAFCMAALKEVENLPLLEAFKEVNKNHPEALPNELVWRSFCKYYAESPPYLDAMRIAARRWQV